jgi:hypothetical protein
VALAGTIETNDAPQKIDQVHRRQALGDGEPDNLVGYADLLVPSGAAHYEHVVFCL